MGLVKYFLLQFQQGTSVSICRLPPEVGGDKIVAYNERKHTRTHARMHAHSYSI